MTENVLVRNAWYVAGMSGEFGPASLQARRIAERPVVLWRASDGRVVAFDDRCCHKRMPLSAGRFIEPDLLECAYHGLCFDTSGACVRVPAHPDGHIPPQARATVLPVIEQDGLVWVWAGDPAKLGHERPARTPEIASDDWDTANINGPTAVPANTLRLVENILDITHFYPLHDGNIGDIENSRIPIEVEEGVADGVAYVGTVREVRDYRLPPFFAEYFGYEIVDRRHTHHMLGPGLTRVRMRLWPAGRMDDLSVERGYVVYNAHTPVDRGNFVWRLMVNMPKGLMCLSDPTKPAFERFAETFPEVIAQDVWALHHQQPMYDCPDLGFHEIFLRPDTALAKARRLLHGLERAEASGLST